MLYAIRSDVETFAQDLTADQLECRDIGHTWRPLTVRYHADEHRYERALHCRRCGTERWQTLSETGEVLGGSYRYPDGYQAKGLGRIVKDGRDALRLESLTRELNQ